ncbi:hypothetical protein EUGRSUZ_C00306 [Eucalyptus grandis]|uniref:Uncharacterized protein n=2 Tax=Eucalyptus grandis TaxID=71139 RepID=A0ACC3LAG1_EUCGR|nr:hypothetical protein EUGRSUZ_C00306 [Eucalyptus grandis]
MATPEENNNVKTLETEPSKWRNEKSIIWEHFTIEIVSPGCRRVCRKQCKQSFAYGTGSKVTNTSQQSNFLWTHQLVSPQNHGRRMPLNLWKILRGKFC